MVEKKNKKQKTKNLGGWGTESIRIFGQAMVENCKLQSPVFNRHSKVPWVSGDTFSFKESNCISVNRAQLWGNLIARGSTRKIDALTFPEIADSPKILKNYFR
jgi:hypothetical protein